LAALRWTLCASHAVAAVVEPIKWREKLDRDGKVIPRCWITDTGYTVAECRVPASRFIVTRGTANVPFAYCSSREEVIESIQADMAAAGDVA
jgi:hypothetical protein